MEKNRQAIGIYGGTFDPVHIAHLRLAIEAKEQLGLSKIIWVPSGNPYHRNAPIASVNDRLSMLETALQDHCDFLIDTVDLYTSEPTYTIHTLRCIRQHYGQDTSLVLLSGSDSFLSLPSWHEWQALFDIAHIAVAVRLNFPLESMSDTLRAEMDRRLGERETIFDQPYGRIVLLPMIECDISASLIREKAKKQLNLSYLLPPAVLNYITQHAVYSEDK